ncbi:MAG: YkgJ family cysteine cluster protein [Rectinemataceae bacterium]
MQPTDNAETHRNLIDFTALAGTLLGERMREVDAIYARIEIAQREFRTTSTEHGSPIVCPPDCGVCCAAFVPDVLPVEAQRLALYLLTENPTPVSRLLTGRDAPGGSPGAPPDTERRTACPFWDPDKPGANCTVYPARPLICRLFGFSAMRDKRGEPEFSLCMHMASFHACSDRTLRGDRLRETLGAFPPAMADYAAELLTIAPQESGERLLLTEALPSALTRVSFTLRLAAEAHDNNEPEPNAPAPLAA